MVSPTKSSADCFKDRVLRPNMGLIDRSVRLIGALSLLYVIFATQLLAGEWVLQFLGVAFAFVNLFAVSTQWCPMYCVTGTDTRGAAARGGV